MKKYISYCRVSSEMQGESGLGLEGQKPVIEHFTQDGEIIAEFTEVQSAKTAINRPELQKAIALAKKENAILVVSKADRLSRNVRDALEILDDLGEDNLLCCDCPETNRFMITMIFAFAEHERLLISIRTKAALKAKKERIDAGTDENAPSGRQAGYSHSDETKAKISASKRIGMVNYDQTGLFYAQDQRKKGATLQQIANDLNKILKVKTPTGKKFTVPNVAAMLKRAAK